MFTPRPELQNPDFSSSWTQQQQSQDGERVAALQGGITWSRAYRLRLHLHRLQGALWLHTAPSDQLLITPLGWIRQRRRVIKNESDVCRDQHSIWSQLTHCHRQRSRLSRGQRSRHCALEGRWWRFLHLLLLRCCCSVTLMFAQLEHA